MSRSPDEPAVPSSYRVHPLLDPRLEEHQPSIAGFWRAHYEHCARDPRTYERLLETFSAPLTGTQPTFQPLAEYFRDADAYLDDLLRLVPSPETDDIRLLPACREANELLDLLRAMFEGDSPRLRYEARRKVQLSRMLFDVDHCRSVRDGPIHRARFEELLQDTIFSPRPGGHVVEVCCRLTEGNGSSRFEVGVEPSLDTRCWRFNVRTLPALDGHPAVEVYDFRTRFKRETTWNREASREDGALRLIQSSRWPRLGRRSGSILSKMIRRGIGDPHLVPDLLGALFIVGNQEQAYELERRLVEPLGGPFRWRDRVDTLTGERDRASLDRHSSAGFHVLKSIVDILTADPTSNHPYLFAVEIQIYTLEAYLRTLHDVDFASHTAYKRRQFLHDLLPLLFPAEVYGELDDVKAALGRATAETA